MSYPRTLPALLTSVSCSASVELEKLAEPFVSAVNCSVCVMVRALAAAGRKNAPVPTMAAVPAATIGVRMFIELPLLPVNVAVRGRLGWPLEVTLSQRETNGRAQVPDASGDDGHPDDREDGAEGDREIPLRRRVDGRPGREALDLVE